MLQAIPKYADLFIDEKKISYYCLIIVIFSENINQIKNYFTDVSIIVYFGVMVCHHSLVSAGDLQLGIILSTRFELISSHQYSYTDENL